MSQWQKYHLDDTYYFIVDSKPGEIIDQSKPETIFCTAFVSTSSCFNGVKKADLPWLKQYKESKSLAESNNIVKLLIDEIMNENFQNLYVWIVSSKFSTINRNGSDFLKCIEKEVNGFILSDRTVKYKNKTYNLEKAKMLIWYNFCLCNLATCLVDKTLQWEKNRGIFLIDRLADSEKRVQEFMQMIMNETAMKKLWKKCAEDHEVKPNHVGFEFPSHLDKNGKIIPAANSMQASLVDWIVLAAYAHLNGQENRDHSFQESLNNLISILKNNKQIQILHIDSEITWT